ncbi:MAG: peptide ABC transporter substrate-binding protein, partial [Candidatus Hydrogenedentes bacterium]|nr:peptide ABC transporter substrate-binding protein [Candidatus Hydrogenedentota bacterium]
GLAIDREELVRNVLKGGEQAAYFLTPPDTAGYTCRARVESNVEKARALLAEAGYAEGKGLPALEILYNTAEADKLIAQTLQRMWRETLGAEVQLQNQDYKVYLDSMSALNYSIARSTWLGDVMDPVNFLECFLTGEGNNRTGWASPEFDRLINAAYHEANEQKRFEFLQQAEALLLEEAPITPVFFQTQKFLKNPHLQGLTPNLLGYVRWQDLSFE